MQPGSTCSGGAGAWGLMKPVGAVCAGLNAGRCCPGVVLPWDCAESDTHIRRGRLAAAGCCLVLVSLKCAPGNQVCVALLCLPCCTCCELLLPPEPVEETFEGQI